MSRRPVDESPINDFLDSQTEAEARESIGAASQEDLDILENRVDSVENRVTVVESGLTELNAPIPIQTLMGNNTSSPTAVPVKPVPIPVDDGGLYINQIDNKIYVGDTTLNGKILYLSSYRSDGKKGTGSIASPLNASSPERIDAIFQELYSNKTPATINFLPHPSIRVKCRPAGDTLGYDWYWYNGLRVKGFGKGRTVFKPANDPSGPVVFFGSSYDPADFVWFGSIEDCSFDGEVKGTYLPDGPPGGDVAYRFAFTLMAGEFQVRNVEFVQLGGRGQEMFPFGLANGAAGYIASSPCNYLIENCSSRDMWGTNGVGCVVHGPFDTTSAYQRALFVNNHFEDMYISWAKFNNITVRNNYLRNGVASAYSNLNCDTEFNKGIDIIGNHLVSAIAGGVAVGSIQLGNWLSKTLGVEIRDIRIIGNTFEMAPNNQPLYTPGVLMVSNCHNWNISDNFYKIANHGYHFSRRGFVSAMGSGNAAKPLKLDDGVTDIPSIGYGFGDSWDLTKNLAKTSPEPIIPDGGPQLPNSDGIMFNNQLIEYDFVTGLPTANYGKTPLSMENKLMSALT